MHFYKKISYSRKFSSQGVSPPVLVIYGLIIDECMYCKGYSRVTGGKVVGIKWNEEWVTKKETYRPFALIGFWQFLGMVSMAVWIQIVGEPLFFLLNSLGSLFYFR